MGTHQRSFKRYHSAPPTASSSQDWGTQPPPKTLIAVISGSCKAITDFKFGWYNQRVHLKKIRILEKRERGRIHTAQFFEYILLHVSQERVKLRTSNFVRTFTVSIGTKAH